MTSHRQTFTFNVNGFSTEASYTENAVRTIFQPLLRQLRLLAQHKGHRIIVFLAAAPAVGKSTLAEFLAFLASQSKDMPAIQAVGMDGFHYHNDYLLSHTILRDDRTILLKDIKGAPETYDVDGLRSKLTAMLTDDILFPYYDRNIHDVREDVIRIQAPVILLEGNYLLLDEAPWKQLHELADYTIYVSADEELLHRRLVERKMRGGTSREDAEAFYESSDRLNVIRVLQHSADADLHLTMTDDLDYHICPRRQIQDIR